MRRTLIPPRIVLQIKLMITLGIEPIPHGIGLQNLRRDLVALPPLLLRLFGYVPRDALLFVVVVENRAAVLGAGVGALAVASRGVVHFVEEFEEGAVGEEGGVEGYLEGFGV